MKMSDTTILITGGTSGIGRELARQLRAMGNTVIVTGRDPERLHAARTVDGLHAFYADVGDPESLRILHRRVVRDFPDLAILINAAGLMRTLDLRRDGPSLEDLTREIQVDLNGTIWMNALILPHLMRRDRAAILNVSSAHAFVPLPIAPIYSAAKAGLHAYTRSLRMQLSGTGVAVFELAPPATDTPLYRAVHGPAHDRVTRPMPVEALATEAIEGMQGDRLEIRPGLADVLKLMGRWAPELAMRRMRGAVRRMQTRPCPDTGHARHDEAAGTGAVRRAPGTQA